MVKETAIVKIDNSLVKSAFSGDIQRMGKVQMAACFKVVEKVGKMVAKRVDEYKDELKALARKEGTKNENGSFMCECGVVNVNLVRRDTSKINLERLTELAKDKGLKLTQVCDITYEPSDKKIENLILEGIITKKEMLKCVDDGETFALTTSISKDDERFFIPVESIQHEIKD